MEFIVSFENGEEKLSQELKMLLATRAGCVPVERDYGISWSCLDAPPDVAENLFYQELLVKTEKYIPDIRIKNISFDYSATGETLAKITCERREERE